MSATRPTVQVRPQVRDTNRAWHSRRKKPCTGGLGCSSSYVPGRWSRSATPLREGDEAWQLLCRQGRADVTLWGHWHFAQVLLGVDSKVEHARIEALLDRFDAQVRTSGAVTWKPYVRMARADLAAAIGDLPAARHQRELAAKELRAMDAVAAGERLEAELPGAPKDA